MADILKFAHDPANKDWELMHCVSADGQLLHATSKGHKAAPVTDSMKAAIGSGSGVRLWHNHPSQDSLSHHDWTCAATCPSVEIVALNETGSLFVGRVPCWDDDYETVFAALPGLAGDLEFKMGDKAKAAGLDIHVQIALSALTGHVLNSGLADSGATAYAHDLSDADRATVLAASDVITFGRDYASAAILRRIAISPAARPPTT